MRQGAVRCGKILRPRACDAALSQILRCTQMTIARNALFHPRLLLVYDQYMNVQLSACGTLIVLRAHTTRACSFMFTLYF
jgi:hypothetical protein